MAHKLDFKDVFRVYTTSNWDLLREVFILKLVIVEMICLRVCVTHGIDFEDVFRVYMTSQWDISREVKHLLILGMSSESIWPLDETYNEKFNIFRSSVLHVKRCSLHLRSYKPTLLLTMVMEIIVISVKNVPK